jgi:hypothetical protein
LNGERISAAEEGTSPYLTEQGSLTRKAIIASEKAAPVPTAMANSIQGVLKEGI